MTTLIYIVQGWLGLFLRIEVLMQAGVAIVLILACQSTILRLGLPEGGFVYLVANLGLIVAFQVAIILFNWSGHSSGLLLLVLHLLATWMALEGLRMALTSLCPRLSVDEYWDKAIKPLYAMIGLLVLLGTFESSALISSIPLFNLFGDQLTVHDIGLLLIVPYFSVVLSEIPASVVGVGMVRLMGASQAGRKTSELLIRYMIILLGMLWLGYQIGINGSTVAGIAAGLSVGLGFAMKEVFSNFVSGIWLLFEGTVRPGEILMFQGDTVEVRHLGPRAATLWRKKDNVELLVPHMVFFTNTTTTYTGTDRNRCTEVQVRAAYCHDPDKVIALLENLALTNPQVLVKPAPKALLADYGESFIDYALRFWINNPMRSSDVRSEMRRAIWQVFHEEGIEFSFPRGMSTDSNNQ